MSTGSSPLARGLPVVRGVQRDVARIIPARAGFTSGPSRDCSAELDHPRSRGVYAPVQPHRGAMAGSSPLARGLLVPEEGVPGLGRIIPARAGFTRQAVRPTRRRRDHPRSRGVYDGREDIVDFPHGSSPLARGLLAFRVSFSCFRGIIPARAGFTTCGGGMGGRRGIIPARAGFTAAGCPRRGPSPDHPRSRGVYVRPAARPVAWAGSSPLARGLHDQLEADLSLLGIIPARAGFTSSRTARHRGSWDHPRSRGVYMRSALSTFSGPGSSPLARGLPQGRAQQRRRPRIIPARAGFTDDTSDVAPILGDHPRSRGVY